VLLTVSKRLEFSSSRRLHNPSWSESENVAAFGPETHARYGTGRNYTAFFIFSGEVDPVTGMLINISEIKARSGRVIDDGYDHRFLNEDNPAFRNVVPTAENLAHRLFADVAPLFTGSARLVAVHLRESPGRSATFYDTGAVEANYWFEFSAARETRSPHLSAEENTRLFGNATAIHGHNYRTRLTFRAEKIEPAEPLLRFEAIHGCVERLRHELDHRHLNRDVAAFKERPMTTESLADYIFKRVGQEVPLDRVRLHERDDLFAESWRDGRIGLGIRMPFSAAHRLHVRSFSEARNEELFGKCNNPRGHGHNYVAEPIISGEYDARSGTVYNLATFQEAVAQALEGWRDRHLDLETEDFCELPSTGENIVQALWSKIDSELDGRLHRLRLWETANNRFTLRQAL
jgi:6-pyruvoyltetrahydropterin/6-carboxytetrahydropterin synthase